MSGLPPDDRYREREVVREPVVEREVVREPVRERHVVHEAPPVRTVRSGSNTGLIIAIVLTVLVLIGAYAVISGMG